MPTRSRIGLAALALALAVAIPAGSARASAITAVAQAYGANGGSIPACEFSSATLNAALGEIGNDGAQYGADLVNAIQAALSQQASGACAKHSAKTSSPAGGAGSTSTPTARGAPPRPSGRRTVGRPAPPAPPAPPPVRAPVPGASVPLPPLAAATDAGVPAPIVILAILGGLLALAATVGWVARRRGWDPAWAASARHAFSEAGFRAGGAWSELADRLRPSRERSARSRAAGRGGGSPLRGLRGQRQRGAPGPLRVGFGRRPR